MVGAGRPLDMSVLLLGKAALTAEMCQECQGAGNCLTPSWVASDSWVRATISDNCPTFVHRFWGGRGTCMNHFGCGVLAWKARLTLLWAAGTPHVLLVLEGLLSQLGVRRKRVPRLHSPLHSHHQTAPAGTKSPSQRVAQVS